jgi:hypothetical protein
VIDITDFKRYTEQAPYLTGRSFCDIGEEKIFLATRPFEPSAIFVGIETAARCN